MKCSNCEEFTYVQYVIVTNEDFFQLVIVFYLGINQLTVFRTRKSVCWIQNRWNVPNLDDGFIRSFFEEFADDLIQLFITAVAFNRTKEYSHVVYEK